MKNYKSFVLLLAFVTSISFTSDISAHPGKTDSNGGHNCRKNCAKWGLSDGEYHYHGGGGGTSSSSSSTSSSTSPSSVNTPKVTVDNKKIEEEKYLEEAKTAYKNNNYILTVQKLNSIYKIDKSTDESDELLEEVASKIIEFSEEHLSKKSYEKSKELVSVLKDNANVSSEIKGKANVIFDENVSIEKEGKELFDSAKKSLSEGKYEEVLSSIELIKGLGVSNIDTKELRKEMINSVIKKSDESFSNKDSANSKKNTQLNKKRFSSYY